MKLRRATLMFGAMVIGVGATLVAGTETASAATVCDQYGSVVAGNYIIQNNRWGTSATQCISTSSNGFTITQQDGVGNMSGAPVSYPSIYLGCHYSNCSPGMTSARQISGIGSATSSITYTYPSSGTYDAAYDIWLNATPDVSAVEDTEIMIWFNHTGSIQPVGSNTGTTASIGGRSWAVWAGNNGQNDVVSYVAPSAISSWSFSVLDFIKDVINRGKATTSWYLTSIQAGFEPWSGGVGLAVSGFSASVSGGNPGTSTTTRTTAPTTRTTTATTTRTTAPTTRTSTASGSRTCSASYSVASSWSGGFVANVTVKAGSSAISGWKVAMSLPGGTAVTSLWGGTASGSSGTVTVSNLSYNGALAASASTSFGFQGTGSGSGASVSCTAS